MERIRTLNRAVDKFGPGKDGFKAAIPGVSEPTYLSPEFFNAVQESLVRVIERAGLVPSANYDQFGDAVVIAPELQGVEGATKVGFLQDGAGAKLRSLQSELRDRPISIKQFGAEADWDGVTGKDNIGALDAAMTLAYLTGRSVFVPAGKYRVSRAIVMNTNAYLRGLILFGEGRDSCIVQTGVNEDGIHFSTTNFLQNSALRDLRIECSKVSGHAVNIVYGCTICSFTNLELVVGNPTKALFYGDWTEFGGGVFDTKWSGGNYYLAGNATALEAGVRFIANGTIFNENMFENLRCFNAGKLQFFHITTVETPDIWLINNSWKNINFEICKGGGFHCDSANRAKLESISFWDVDDEYTNHLIDFVAGAGYESTAVTIVNVGRSGGRLAPGVRDIRIISGQDTIIKNCYTQSADNPSYDFNLKRVTVIGRLYGVLNNTNTAVMTSDMLSIKSAIMADAYVDTLKLGGTYYPDSADIKYGSGFVQIIPKTASSGVILSAQTAALQEKKLVWQNSGLYPLADNEASLGLGQNCWSVVYSRTGAINTSDARLKCNFRDLNASEIAAARDLARTVGVYRWRDAVDSKGTDAREHVGLTVQRAIEIMQAHGLNPFNYGFICHDEWDRKIVEHPAVEARPAILDNPEHPAVEAQEPYTEVVLEAGDRYAFRCDELNMFIAAGQEARMEALETLEARIAVLEAIK